MRIVTLRRGKLGLLAIVGGVIALVVHCLAATAPTLEDIYAADLTALEGRIIAIDPGHGGIDSGAKYYGREEKELTLALALRLAETLEKSGASVVLTRQDDSDYYVRGKGGKRQDLLKRVELINLSGAALFISVHTNAIAGARWSGAETYYNPKWPENKLLAETLQTALQPFPPGNKRQAKQDNGILVLKDTNIPGVLVEAGFLSNPAEASMLADVSYQQKMCEHIAKALAYHFSRNVVR